MNSTPLTVRDAIDIQGTLTDVYESFWEAEAWPSFTPHVRRIEMLERRGTYQRFRMTIASRDQMHTMETERTATPGRSITYRQLTPPPFLLEHTGQWTFTALDSAIRVELVHRVIIDEAEARQRFGTGEPDQIRMIVREALSRNGRTTMECVKARIEAYVPSR